MSTHIVAKSYHNLDVYCMSMYYKYMQTIYHGILRQFYLEVKLELISHTRELI
jgi:hypothetical protein